MIQKEPLIHHRVRRLEGSFAWISHRFLRDGFWTSLSHHELVLYLFLVIVGDRQGLSYYGFDKICTLTGMDTDTYIDVRNDLINKDLIAFDGYLFQVLSLPDRLVSSPLLPIVSQAEMIQRDPGTIHQIVTKQFGRGRGGQHADQP